MKKPKLNRAFAASLCVALTMSTSLSAQSSWEGDKPTFDIEEQYIRWPLPASEKRYGSIEGNDIKRLMNEVIAISHESREAGDPLWGRIAGSKYDLKTQAWFAEKMKALNIPLKVDQIPLGMQLVPERWEVSIGGPGSAVSFKSAYPLLRTSKGTAAGGVDLNLAWVGFGTQADFAGKDIRGKAVVIYSSPITGGFQATSTFSGAIRRAQEGGAAAIIQILGIPGNVGAVLYGGGALPGFTIGMEDGNTLREAIEANPSQKVHINLSLKATEGLESANVIATLPGTTDENIILIAHTDGFFEAANDNASGLATMVKLAEYYSKIPKAQRRRNILFMATAAHHANPASPGTMDMHKNWASTFAKTAMVINVEHISETQLYMWGKPPLIRKSTGMNARIWNVFASPAVESLIGEAFKAFGYNVYDTPQVQPSGDINSIAFDAPSFGISDLPLVYHTDLDRAEFIPAAGLEGGGRVLAKVIDGINKLTLTQIVRTTPHPGDPRTKAQR